MTRPLSQSDIRLKGPLISFPLKSMNISSTDIKIAGSEEQEIYGKECIRQNKGKILMYGDEFGKNYFDSQPTAPLFNHIFQSVNA